MLSPNNNGPLYATIVIFALLVLGGFYFIFNKIANLEMELKSSESTVQNLSLQAAALNAQNQQSTDNKQNQNNANAAANSNQTSNNGQATTTTIIETSILFDVQSNPILQPQTKITILVQNVGKANDGTIDVTFKAFTNEATTYSAIEPRDFFELVNLTGDNQKPLSVKGQFTSMPPRTGMAGDIIFKIDPSQNNLILQTGSGDNIKFYQFDFLKKTYKETVIG